MCKTINIVIIVIIVSIIVILTTLLCRKSSERFLGKTKKIVILYVFHEYNERVKYFLKNVIFYDKNIHFVVICNSETIQFSCPKYVKVLHRPNIGYDFAGWSYGLFKDNLYHNYDYFIFINSSVMGPYLTNKKSFVNKYLDPLSTSVKLFGSTINTIKEPKTMSHIQSSIFSMDKQTLQFLIDKEIFSLTNIAKTFKHAIWDKEVKMSRLIIENGWNIGCRHKLYKNVDFRFKDGKSLHPNLSKYGDIMLPKYRNVLWTNKELIFVKGNRLNITDVI